MYTQPQDSMAEPFLPYVTSPIYGGRGTAIAVEGVLAKATQTVRHQYPSRFGAPTHRKRSPLPLKREGW